MYNLYSTPQPNYSQATAGNIRNLLPYITARRVGGVGRAHTRFATDYFQVFISPGGIALPLFLGTAVKSYHVLHHVGLRAPEKSATR